MMLSSVRRSFIVSQSVRRRRWRWCCYFYPKSTSSSSSRRKTTAVRLRRHETSAVTLAERPDSSIRFRRPAKALIGKRVIARFLCNAWASCLVSFLLKIWTRFWRWNVLIIVNASQNITPHNHRKSINCRYNLSRVWCLFTIASIHYDCRTFLPALRYASAVFATATCPSVCPSVRLSQPVLCENGAF